MPLQPSIITPDYLSPVNGNIWYTLTSASASSIPGYKYVIDIWSVNQTTGATSSKLGRFKIPPRPSDFRGIFSADKALRTLISNIGPDIISSNITSITSEPELYCKYMASYGFEVNPNLDYYDFVNSPSFGVAFSYNPGLITGDVITVNKTNNTLNPQYNGIHTVGTYSTGTVSIAGLTFGAWFVGLDGSFGSSTPTGADGGLITNLLRVSSTSSTLLGYGGTRQYNQVVYDFTDNYLTTTSSGGYFLTNYGLDVSTKYKKVRMDEYETLSIIFESMPASVKIVTETFDSIGTLINTYNVTKSISSTGRYFYIPSGPQNLMSMYSNTSMFNGVDNYRISIYDTTITTKYTNYFYYKIDTQCSLYDTVRLVFLNRMGGYDYFSFIRDNKKNVNINRSEYKKVLEPGYSFGERGQTTLAQDIQYTFTLNSDWVSEYDYSWLEELITSPNIFIVSSTNILTPINITDTSYQIKTQLRDKLFNLTINYKLSYNINIQNQ